MRNNGNPPQWHTGGVGDYTLFYPAAGERLLALLLDRVAFWLALYAYDDYRDTITWQSQRLVDVLALAAYVSALTSLPVVFTAAGTDLPARRLLAAFAFLAQGCSVSVSTAAGECCRQVDATTPARDLKTAEFAELPLLPPLAVSSRGTAAILRRALLDDAGERCSRILSNGTGPGEVVRSVGRVAGGRWPEVAEVLAGGEVGA